MADEFAVVPAIKPNIAPTESPRCIVLIVFREEVSHHKNEIQYSKWTIDEMCCVGYYM